MTLKLGYCHSELVEESMILILTLKPKRHRFFTKVQNDTKARLLSFRACRGIYGFAFSSPLPVAVGEGRIYVFYLTKANTRVSIKRGPLIVIFRALEAYEIAYRMTRLESPLFEFKWGTCLLSKIYFSLFFNSFVMITVRLVLNVSHLNNPILNNEIR